MMPARNQASVRTARIILALIGTAFLIVGILRSEPLIVMSKAVKICLECIGIG